MSGFRGLVPECARVCMHTNMNGAKSPEMRVGPGGGLRDICVAPESFLRLHFGLVTWVHHGDRMHVWDPV